jgi:hypothetical protein
VSHQIALAEALACALDSNGHRPAEYRAVVEEDREMLERLGLYVCNDATGGTREKLGKDLFKETVPVLLFMVAPVDSKAQFKEHTTKSECLLEFSPEGRILTAAGGITWQHDPPNKWRLKFAPELIKEKNGIVSGTFMACIELTFWRWFR